MLEKWKKILMVTILVGTVSSAFAAKPWDLLSMRRVDASPKKIYRLTDENGPWLVMATTFSGEGAETQAKELVLELRKRYKVPAYIHQVSMNYESARGRGLDEFGRPHRVAYQRGEGVNEVAVLVGNYTEISSKQAQETLSMIKYARPECLKLDARNKTNQTLAGWRMIQKEVQEKIGSKKKAKGPMGHAFLTTNPLLSKDFFAPKGLDPFVVSMNRIVSNSLLSCPGKYTIQVATFKGHDVIDPKEIAEIERGKKVHGKLKEAAKKADVLTAALRMKGWPAYQFHDRNSSIVCVGSFNSLGTAQTNGQQQFNSEVQTIFETFSAAIVHGKTTCQSLDTTLGRIPFDVQAKPIPVPKRSIARELTLN